MAGVLYRNKEVKLLFWTMIGNFTKYQFMAKTKKENFISPVLIVILAVTNFYYVNSEEVLLEYIPSELIVKTKSDSLDKLGKLNKKFDVAGIERIDDQTFKLTLGDSDADIQKAIKKYSQNKDVELAEPNYLVRAATIPNDSLFNLQWGLNNTGQTVNNIAGKNNVDINGSEAWDITQGSGDIKIAILDTGANYNHEDLIERIVVGYDFVNNDSDPADDSGHGTILAGIIGGQANNAKGIAGVDWKAKIMPIKILGADGAGTVSDLIRGIDYAVNAQAKVINMSLVGNYSAALDSSIKNAYDHGIVLVSAAGNDQVDLNSTKMSPISNDGDNNWVIGVGSIGQSGNASAFSNYGSQYIDVVSPGENIISSYNSSNNGYVYGSGTSLSAGFVSGLAGLIISKYPNINVGTIKQKIINKADDLGLGSSFGKGNINGPKALASNLKKIGVMKKEIESDYNFYVYNAPADTSPQNLTGQDLWNIPSGNNTVAITGVDIDGDGTKELAVMKNENKDYNFYVYNSPNGSSPQLIRAMDLWNIPSGDNTVAIAGVDYNGDGKDELAVMKNENGDYNLYIYFAPTTTEATFLIGGDKWNIPSGDNVIAMTGFDVDGDGKDEIAVMKNEGGDYNLYVYRAPNGMEPTALLGVDKWSIPDGNNTVGITGVDINDDGIDELGIMKNESGDYNFYVYQAPATVGAMPKLAGDKWNIPSGDNAVGVATVE